MWRTNQADWTKVRGNGFANQMLEDPTYSNYRMTNELLEALTSTNDPRTLYIGGAYYTDSKRTDITSIVYEKTGSYQGVPAQDFIYNARHRLLPSISMEKM